MTLLDRTRLVGNGIPLLLCGWLACCASSPEPRQEPEKKTSPGVRGDPGLKDPGEVADALKRAEGAFLAGDWGSAVVQANKVMEGAASPEEYYAAVKILGLASCNRKDPKPVSFTWKRLQPADQDSLRRQCAMNGLEISDEGQVTTSSP